MKTRSVAVLPRDVRTARVLEVFSSLQGEGARLGERQIFVRFGGCNLHCDYCDEPKSIPLDSGVPTGAARLKESVLRLSRAAPHRSISWTGGEPLLFPAFLRGMMIWAREQGFENHLETNGTLAAALRPLAPLCEVVAMDVKLPTATGRRHWSAHEEFLSVAPAKTFVKVVLTESSREEEIREVVALLERFPGVRLFLQPATESPSTRRAGGMIRPIAPAKAVRFLALCRRRLKDVRLQPQWHPIWGLR